MHRDGSGNRIADIEAARAEWFAQNRTKSTYCGKAEWEAWPEDIGELAHKTDNGTEIRQRATIKTTCRGGSRKIVHCCVIVGNPAAYAKWNADPNKQGWMAEWTYYPASHLQTLLSQERYGATTSN